MSAFPKDLRARPRPRDAFERVQPRWRESSISLGALLGAVLVALVAGFAPTSALFTLTMRIMFAVAAVALLRVIGRRARRSAAWPAGIEEGLVLYRAGDLGAAQARLESVLRERRVHPAFRAVALAGCASIALRKGEAARAQDLWAEVARSGHWKERGLRFALSGVPGWVALAAAIEGDLPRAQRWLEESPKLGGELGLGTRLLASSYVALRSGDAQAAREMAREHWAQAEATLGPAEARALRVLAALAERDAASPIAQSWREGARPGWPGELDYLARGWPELAAYLAAHQFGSANG